MTIESFYLTGDKSARLTLIEPLKGLLNQPSAARIRQKRKANITGINADSSRQKRRFCDIFLIFPGDVGAKIRIKIGTAKCGTKRFSYLIVENLSQKPRPKYKFLNINNL